MRLNFILNCNQFNKKKTLNRSVKEIKPKLNLKNHISYVETMYPELQTQRLIKNSKKAKSKYSIQLLLQY